MTLGKTNHETPTNIGWGFLFINVFLFFKCAKNRKRPLLVFFAHFPNSFYSGQSPIISYTIYKRRNKYEELNKQEKAYYKKMLSNTSKLGVKSISLNIIKNKTGSKLAKKKGSVCHGCYALKGCYQFPVVQEAMARRMKFFYHKDFIPIMVWLLESQTKSFFRWFDKQCSKRNHGIKHFRNL